MVEEPSSKTNGYEENSIGKRSSRNISPAARLVEDGMKGVMCVLEVKSTRSSHSSHGGNRRGLWPLDTLRYFVGGPTMLHLAEGEVGPSEHCMPFTTQ